MTTRTSMADHAATIASHPDVDRRGRALSVESLDTYYAEGDPKPLGWTFEGRAVKQGDAVSS